MHRAPPGLARTSLAPHGCTRSDVGVLRVHVWDEDEEARVRGGGARTGEGGGGRSVNGADVEASWRQRAHTQTHTRSLTGTRTDLPRRGPGPRLPPPDSCLLLLLLAAAAAPAVGSSSSRARAPPFLLLHGRGSCVGAARARVGPHHVGASCSRRRRRRCCSVSVRPSDAGRMRRGDTDREPRSHCSWSTGHAP